VEAENSMGSMRRERRCVFSPTPRTSFARASLPCGGSHPENGQRALSGRRRRQMSDRVHVIS
jgi:hypothetical protein